LTLLARMTVGAGRERRYYESVVLDPDGNRIELTV